MSLVLNVKFGDFVHVGQTTMRIEKSQRSSGIKIIFDGPKSMAIKKSRLPKGSL